MKTESIFSAGNSIGTTIFRLGAIGAVLVASLAAMDASPALGQSFYVGYGSVVPPDHRGIVIANGVYLPPPYQFELVGQELHINDLVFRSDDLNLKQSEQFDLERNASWGARRGEGMRRSRRSQPHDPMYELLGDCRSTALMDGVIVLSNGHMPLMLDQSGSGNDLLAALLRPAGAASSQRPLVELPVELVGAPNAVDYLQAWEHAVDEFKPSPEFQKRAGETVSRLLAVSETSDRIVKASLWADSISYPLTLFAMIVVVVAFGHLLSNKPRLEDGAAGSGVSPETQKVVLKSLLIFGLLSLVDLIWTISASATGSMREMNPLGNGLIHDPIRLILFKTIAVSLTIGLLYTLHRRPIAQVASWWSCLVLTLLTARWLTFHSMFM